MKICINDLIKGDLIELEVYGKKVEIPSLGFSLKSYMSIEEKVGLAHRLLSVLFDPEKSIYDSVNAKFLIPVFFLEAYCEDIQFPDNMEDMDATGVYDYLLASGSMYEINELLGHELAELKSVIDEIVKMEYRKHDSKNPMADFLGDISTKNPEDLEKMTNQIGELMKDENVQNMIKFKEAGDQ
jgi:hypothetical protein